MHYSYPGFRERHQRDLRLGIALRAIVILLMTAALVALFCGHGIQSPKPWIALGACICLGGLIAMSMYEKLKQLKVLREP